MKAVYGIKYKTTKHKVYIQNTKNKIITKMHGANRNGASNLDNSINDIGRLIVLRFCHSKVYFLFQFLDR